MAFKVRKKSKEQLELVSLIDMILILLVFFLVTSYVMQLKYQEEGIYVPTPENKPGRAQIVLQLMAGGNFFWLDEGATQEVRRLRATYGFLPEPDRSRSVVSALADANVFGPERLEERLSRLKDRARNHPDATFFILIRCPNALPYARVMDVIASLTDAGLPNIKYGCVGGEMRDLRALRRIDLRSVRDGSGAIRENITIDF